jgi:hypothetical protein
MKIFLSILNEGFISDELTIKLPRWLNETINNRKHDIYYESSKLRPIENNRNDIVKRFLDTNFDYLLQIDCDNVPANNPFELVDYNLDIISCPVWVYQHRLMLNIYKQENEYLVPIEYDKNLELIEVDATGSGVLLCSKKVLESIEKPFERIYDEKGIAVLGLDLSFSRKAKKQGFKIYSHMQYICKHYKNIDISTFNIQNQ